jgi:Flp pilus assembly protein TadG
MRNLIVGLARPMLRMLGRDDRGAIGVLVAVLIGGGVLFGMGALVIDVGRLYQNRAELQNGADAGALGVARSCVLTSCTASSAMNTATGYAVGNASKLTGNKAAVTGLCGSGAIGCTGDTANCPPQPTTSGVGWVNVLASTQTPTGTVVPPVFARTLLGNSSYSGTTVKACAQAEWGAPASADTVAFTISACTWDLATNNGTSFAPPPPYPPNPATSFDQVIQLHTTTSNTSCPTEPAGADAPGNFGWTDDSGNCNVTVSGNSYGGSTGTSVSQDCLTAINNDWLNKTLVFVPVYTIVSGTGTNSTYTLKGFAAFVITGYYLPAGKQHQQGSDWLNPKNNCKGNEVCINGFFTQGLIPSPGTVGGKPMGADIIQLTG